MKLPDCDIVVVHRSDGSGTTLHLHRLPEQRQPGLGGPVGKGTSVKWPVGLGGKGNEGVAGQVKQLPAPLAMWNWSTRTKTKCRYADMKNAAGNFVTPSLDSVTAALATAKIPDDFRFSMVNAPGRQGVSDCRRDLAAGL